jgi:hypothetical protein
MSDFLSRLAARALRAADSLTPRVPALFEPPVVGGDARDAREVLSDQSRVVASREPDRDQPPQQRAPSRASVEVRERVGNDRTLPPADTVLRSEISDAERHAVTAADAAAPAAAPVSRAVPAVVRAVASPVRPEPRLSRSRRVEAEASQSSRDVDRAPEIHVHIGRVEVRAVLPTPAPRAETPKAPAVSLDDYLKRADGRSR